MLYDKEFLLQLDKHKHKVIYARVTSLTFQETPIEYIEGRVTQGSINLDGASACRRSCSLTIVAPDFQYNDYYWGLNTKFILEIGVENVIDSKYPDIIWFKQGIYLITSFNTSRSTNNFSISIQGKDKMCLLDGSVGGSLESSVDFGTIEEENKDGLWTIRKVPIPEIIKNMVHTYAGEPYYNIIINDLDTYGLELLEYRYDTPMFLYRQPNDPVYINGFIKGDEVIVKTEEHAITTTTLDKLDDSYFESLTQTLTEDIVSPIVYVKTGLEFQPYHIAKIKPGQTAGYRYMDLVYDGDLIANIGESITSVLDKIKKMLTEFEYFYNLEGQFVFQKKQSVKETMWQFDDEKAFQQLTENIATSSCRAYEFHGSELISAFNNNPNLLNMRNDYSIWGEKDSISGAKIPIHLRYAIDKKPVRYTKISVDYGSALTPGADYASIKKYNDKYQTDIAGQVSKEYTTEDYDWREIIYQMALDYYKYNFLDDFELKVAAANPVDYPTGRTGYEQYYVDLQGFWRQLYCPEEEQSRIQDIYDNALAELTSLQESLYGTEENSDNGLENQLRIFTNATDEERKIYMNEWDYDFKYEDGTDIKEISVYLSMLNDEYFRMQNSYNTKLESYEGLSDKYFYLDDNEYYAEGKYKYWNRKVYEQPDQLNFWFDFLDTSGDLSQFSVQAVGSRSKVVNDTKVKSIYFRETPSVIYVAPGDPQPSAGGYRYIQAPDIDHMFARSAQGKSAKNKLSELLHQHGYCIENATITAIPIYYLEPNTRIYLHDEETGLEGEFITSKITIPLNYNGTMSITATKAAENIL